MENNGPTLNPAYNDTLLGGVYKPRCEECGCDLTGKVVVGTYDKWICTLCVEEMDLDKIEDKDLEGDYFDPEQEISMCSDDVLMSCTHRRN